MCNEANCQRFWDDIVWFVRPDKTTYKKYLCFSHHEELLIKYDKGIPGVFLRYHHNHKPLGDDPALPSKMAFKDVRESIQKALPKIVVPTTIKETTTQKPLSTQDKKDTMRSMSNQTIDDLAAEYEYIGNKNYDDF